MKTRKNTCHCVIRHAITEEERQQARDSLA